MMGQGSGQFHTDRVLAPKPNACQGGKGTTMRGPRCFLIPCLLLAAILVPARGEEPDELKALIDKALKAAGGEEKLNQFQTYILESKSVLRNGNSGTGRAFARLPDQYRHESEDIVFGRKSRSVIVINGNQGWRKQDDRTEELSKEAIANLKRSLPFSGVRTILHLKNPAYNLSLLGETKVGDRIAVGIKLTDKARPERGMSFLFEKATSLLLKEENLHKQSDGNTILFERIYGDYQEVDGIPIARKVIAKRDGEIRWEADVTVKFVDKLDDKLFEKP
jgi:hypothetical protein